jgi:ADP-ribose pyrophosphatase YjhB (NUDIX family)
MRRNISTSWSWPADRRVFAVSIKGMLCPSIDNLVLLFNERDEWELPGGRLKIVETPRQCVTREIREELRLEVRVESILDSYLFEVVPGKHIFVVTYGCSLIGNFDPIVSSEHQRFGLFPLADLPSALPFGYRASIETWRKQQLAGTHI